MENMNTLKWYVKEFKDDFASILLYEVDLENDRYATQMVEIFEDGKVKRVEESGSRFITEAPIPTVQEINKDYPDFYAETITKEEFETVYASDFYGEKIDFPDSI